MRIGGTRITTAHVWEMCAGSDSADHLKTLRRYWPYTTAGQFKLAIRFEREKRIPTTGRPGKLFAERDASKIGSTEEAEAARKIALWIRISADAGSKML